MPNITSLGRHLIAEFYGCDVGVLGEVARIESAMKKAAESANAQIVNLMFHRFAPYGVSGVVVIQESHLAIHSWPEYGYASVDIFTCGNLVNPWKSVESLEKTLGAKKTSCIELNRGQISQLPEPLCLPPPAEKTAASAPNFTQDLWFTEQTRQMALSVRHTGKLLHSEQTPFQKITVYQTPAFGHLLALDGSIAFTEKDEQIYHEMLVHIPLLTHPKPENALVLGGGDGGAVREILRHETVKNITVLEQDARITAVCRQFFPALKQTLSHPKVKLIYQSAAHFTENTKAQYDFIVADFCPPLLADKPRIEEKMYQSIKKRLSANGVLVVPTGSPTLNPSDFQQTIRLLNAIFAPAFLHFYLAYIPSLLSGISGFVLISPQNTACAFAERQEKLLKQHKFRYYNREIHESSFVHPNFIRDLFCQSTEAEQNANQWQ